MFRGTKRVVRRKVKPGYNRSPAHQSQQRLLQETLVYLMHNFPFFFLNKFGITDHIDARRKNVSETTPGYVFHFFAPRLEFGWQLEQFVHSLYRLQNVHFWTGSGKSEWYVVFNPIVGGMVWYFAEDLGFVLTWKQYALAFFMPFVWLDGLFWLLVFSGLRLVFYLGLLLLFIYFLAHIH